MLIPNRKVKTILPFLIKYANNRIMVKPLYLYEIIIIITLLYLFGQQVYFEPYHQYKNFIFWCKWNYSSWIEKCKPLNIFYIRHHSNCILFNRRFKSEIQSENKHWNERWTMMSTNVHEYAIGSNIINSQRLHKFACHCHW